MAVTKNCVHNVTHTREWEKRKMKFKVSCWYIENGGKYENCAGDEKLKFYVLWPAATCCRWVEKIWEF